MSLPQKCTVLVVGGGPAGSFAAAALAREGIDVVLVEADRHPRYHIGESMLPSMRHFLEFIDCYDAFNSHGFIKKNGAAFRLNRSQPEACKYPCPDCYTDFIAANGPQGHAWNVVRSEADKLLFDHAGASGAHTFDATKVDSVQFVGTPSSEDSSAAAADSKIPNPGRPVSATWIRKEDGSSGTIHFDYLIDASGRYGLLSTKYLKNRKFNQNLKNIANWGYWKGGGTYGVGTHKAGSPFFEALTDGSGWCWFIPLHDGTHSIGIVQNQAKATAKKRAAGSPTTKEFYLQSLDLVPGIRALLAEGELVSDIKSASDWSYSASSYAFPYARIAGDAGCFIDPYFSSGVHLAVLGGISAAVTIAASIRGDLDEVGAASWHSKKISESYTRFFLVVSSALKQIQSQGEPVIQDIDEEGFQRAFDLFRPVIQGTADADPNGKLSQSEVSATVEFCFKAFTHVTQEQKEAVVKKLKSLGADGEAGDEETIAKSLGEVEKSLTAEEVEVLNILRSRRMIREDGMNLDSFTLDAIDGLRPRMVRGSLGLTKASAARLNNSHLYSADFLEGKRPGFRARNAEDGIDGSSANGIANGHGQHGGQAYESMNGAENEAVKTTPGTTTNGHANGHPNGHTNGTNGNASPQDSQGRPTPVVVGSGASAPPLDDVSRHTVMNTLYAAAENLETPFDMLMRLANTARVLSLIRVGIQLGVFRSLSASPNPLTVEELAAPTGASQALVRRVVRYLAANRLLAELGPGLFGATKATRFLAEPGMEGGMTFFQGVVAPATQHLPLSLARDGFAERARKPWVFHDWAGVDGDTDLYPWLKTHPDLLAAFQNLMTVDRGGDWIDCLPDAEEGDRRPVFLVDVGGNVGHQSKRLLAARPHLAGRVVVQDLAETVAAAPPAKGIMFAAHDFFTPQPVAGARYYYLRSILHNWADEQAVEILRNLVPALAADSQVLIDEIVVPDTGADAWVAGQDINMMLLFGGRERMADEWAALLDRAGLKIVDIKTYVPVRRSSIIFAMLK
uniref:Putative flavin-dependent halogenase/O-methyltransferase bifunctional protein n=1 Tax=Floropilus chiversii TaxID=2587399 RepID=C5H890_FLOCH|nr:putative flavin-dependent halogenase/O-methyltransferase bifunctional protein [Floropilus chiversii]